MKSQILGMRFHRCHSPSGLLYQQYRMQTLLLVHEAVPIFDAGTSFREENSHLHAATSRLVTSNGQGMKKALNSLAPLLCLLTILLSTVRCVHAERPRQASCSHCPKHAPLSHSLPSCCTSHQQSPALVSSEIKGPIQSISTTISVFPEEIALLSSFPITQFTASPHPPPLIALRI